MIVFDILATVFALITIPVVTFVIASSCIITALLGIDDRAGSPYDFLPRWWAKACVFLAGSRGSTSQTI